MDELKNMQEEVVALIRQIWDAESLEIIHGSVRSIIKAKKLVMMVDTSCGPSQPNMDQHQGPTEGHGQHQEPTEGHDQQQQQGQQITSIATAPEEHEREEPEEEEEEDQYGECESDMGDSPDEGDNGTMVLKEDGDYLTQIIMDVLPPPRIIFNKTFEDCEYDSWFENFESADFDQQTEKQPVQDSQDNAEERRRATVVENFLNTPIELINAQCPFFLTSEEASRLLSRDFSPIREVNRTPTENITSNSQTQSNFSIYLKIDIISFPFSHKGHHHSCAAAGSTRDSANS